MAVQASIRKMPNEINNINSNILFLSFSEFVCFNAILLLYIFQDHVSVI